MKNKKTYNDFLQILSVWENELDKYNLEQLLQKENNEIWSLGQLYNHLIEGTLNYHIPQIKECVSSGKNTSKKKNFKGFMVFNLLHAFPPIKIKVPPSDFYTPKQPKDVQSLKKGFDNLKQEMKTVLELLKNDKKGKTAHPGFSYLNAQEWFQLIPMHFKHHIKQKKYLDLLLNKNAK